MSTVVTLTLNPSIDVHTSVSDVIHTEKMRCSTPRFDPGGAGVNVARALVSLGTEATAIVTAGGWTGSMLVDRLRASGPTVVSVPVGGSTRENTTVVERRTSRQFRFVMPGPRLSAGEEAECLAVFENSLPSGGSAVISGSMPPGFSRSFLARAAAAAARRSCRLVVDTSGPALASVTNAFLIKPSLRELRDVACSALPDRASRVAAARDLVRAHTAEVVVISLGARGELVVTADAAVDVPGVPVSGIGGLGAGDNMVAAIVHALDAGAGLIDAVRLGVAAGAAATLTPGSDPCRRSDVDRLRRPTGPS